MLPLKETKLEPQNLIDRGHFRSNTDFENSNDIEGTWLWLETFT